MVVAGRIVFLLLRQRRHGDVVEAELGEHRRAHVELPAPPVDEHEIPRVVPDSLTLFGLVAVTAMLVFYALEDRSRWFILAFAGACALGSLYGFLQGAWPFGLVEAVWALVAVRRWTTRAATRL